MMVRMRHKQPGFIIIALVILAVVCLFVLFVACVYAWNLLLGGAI